MHRQHIEENYRILPSLGHVGLHTKFAPYEYGADSANSACLRRPFQSCNLQRSGDLYPLVLYRTTQGDNPLIRGAAGIHAKKTLRCVNMQAPALSTISPEKDGKLNLGERAVHHELQRSTLLSGQQANRNQPSGQRLPQLLVTHGPSTTHAGK